MARLTGKRAIITGGANGMGAAIARRFVAEGAEVVITDIEDDALAAQAAEIGEMVQHFHLDVSLEEDWTRVSDHITTSWGGVDILVNNAGLFSNAGLAGTTVEQFERIIRVNQLGCFLGMRVIAPLIAEAGGGSIINLSSAAGLRGVASMFAYGASKWAVRGMTKCAAIELAAAKIRVNSIHPGAISTRMILENTQEVNEAIVNGTPLGRRGEPGEVADLVLFLASDESTYITGAEVAIDGGVSI
ncbi:MAG TPA: glucose 1-dehydrogenase [Sphingobium sp.]|uniref:glucose 1-dehydrogenase n=1 Tax=Sphingobium sp. TaxID=1912891 RepID=UPI002ED137D8